MKLYGVGIKPVFFNVDSSNPKFYDFTDNTDVSHIVEWDGVIFSNSMNLYIAGDYNTIEVSKGLLLPIDKFSANKLYARSVWSGLQDSQDLLNPYFKEHLPIPVYITENPITIKEVLESSTQDFMIIITGLLASYDPKTGCIYRYLSDDLLMGIISRFRRLNIPVSMDWYKIRPLLRMRKDVVDDIVNMVGNPYRDDPTPLALFKKRNDMLKGWLVTIPEDKIIASFVELSR
jgi:hypothetical protein